MYNPGGSKDGRGVGFGGFSIHRKGQSVETHLAQMAFNLPGMGGRYGHGSNLGKKRVKNEEAYFDEDEDEGSKLEYQPAPGSPTGEQKKQDSDDDSDASADPLYAFMAGIADEVQKQGGKTHKKKTHKKGVRDDIDNEDDEESYYRYVEENPQIITNADEDDVEYDEDGNAIIPEYRKVIDPLPPMDHSEINYASFNKNFYEEHPDIQAVPYSSVNQLRDKLGIRISGILPPKPVTSFAHFGFDEALMKSIRKAGYETPTPIQAQGIPVAMGGRDLIGIAKTGSGKTAAYLWPLLVHIMDQKELEKGDGPVGLILAPTRELAQQIYHEARKFGKVYNIKVVCAYGGGNMWEQCKACEEGAEIIVGTPGRMIDIVKKKATNLRRCTYLVLDEADRMFDMGFEPQVQSIADHIRPDRQTLLFSATFKKRVERIARCTLTDPMRILQGELGEANEDVTQIVQILQEGAAKWRWLVSHIVGFTTIGSVLIFVTRKANSEELANNLKLNDFKVGLLHGDMDQTERNSVITSFKRREMLILVATDVAARGLDIPSIKTVINYDVARDIDTHTHRVGRTGRAGEKGTAYTMVTNKDKEFAGHLVRNLEMAGQFVLNELLDLALQNPWFKKNRFKQMKAKRLDIGSGLGFKERPGLGSGSGGDSGEASNFTHYEPTQTQQGPGSERISTMKSAFMQQFKSNFVKSKTDPEPAPPSPPPPVVEPITPPESKRRKRSRWE